MWFPHREVRRLLVAAGGEFKPGDKLKHYWWVLCEDLVMYTDTVVQPRTLEDAWQRGILSKRVKSALERLVWEKRKLKAKPYDDEFISGVKIWIEWAKTNDTIFPRHELALLSAFSAFLDRVASLRHAMDDQIDRVTSCKARLEVTQAVANQSNEAAE